MGEERLAARGGLPVALLLAAVGCAGWLAPGVGSGPWIWAALWGPAGGVLAGGLLPGALGLLPSGLIALALAALGPGPDAATGALAVAALGAVGWGLGPRRASPAGVGAALAASGLLAGVATLWGSAGEPLPPGVAARCLDVSPVGWVLESAGLDWMRHASIYEAAGSGDLGPEARVARGGRSGPFVLLGAALVLGAGRRRPRSSGG